MFTNISWPMYLAGLVVVLVVYYVYVGLRYYGFELRRLCSPKDKRDEVEVFDMFPLRTGDPDIRKQEEMYEDVEHLSSTIKVFVAESQQSTFDPAAFVAGLKEIFATYSHLKDSPFRTALNEVILSECGRYGNTLIDLDDVDEAWGG